VTNPKNLGDIFIPHERAMLLVNVIFRTVNCAAADKISTDLRRGHSVTRWLYCVECPQYSIRLEALGFMCDCRTVLYVFFKLND